jgi:1,4-alpha-glucan branching enzyme
MLTDELLVQRYGEHMDSLIALADKELERTRPEPHYHRLAEMYSSRFHSLRHTWRCHAGNLIAAFRELQDAGVLEIITSTATHPFAPHMDRNWAALRSQVHTAAALYEEHFGRRSVGMWLGECGFTPGIDELLREAGVRYFFVDTHSVLHADRHPAFGVYAPIYCPTGVAAFARDTQSSEQVWSAKHGYPGDPQYRDFYRDIGFDLPLEYIGPHVHPEGHRMATGFKYHAITHEALHDKWVYDPDVARGRAGLHASHFRGNMEKQIQHLAGNMDRPPIVVSPYDAELYGHWWYEGPVFLGDLFRQLHFDQDVIEPITPTQYLERHPTNQVATPGTSSWGLRGYGEMWCSESNAWTWRHIHKAGERMVELARRHGGERNALRVRALKQAARELMLAQASDWPFIMATGTMVAYATRRFNEHIIRFTRLYEDLKADAVDEPYLADLEGKDNIFPQVDYRLYAT